MALQHVLNITLNRLGGVKCRNLHETLVIGRANDAVAYFWISGDDDLYEYRAVLRDYPTAIEVTEDRFGCLQAVNDLNVLQMYRFAGDGRTGSQNRDAIVQPPEVGRCRVSKGCRDI